jgi:hypothetical protein
MEVYDAHPKMPSKLDEVSFKKDSKNTSAGVRLCKNW